MLQHCQHNIIQWGNFNNDVWVQQVLYCEYCEQWQCHLYATCYVSKSTKKYDTLLRLLYKKNCDQEIEQENKTKQNKYSKSKSRVQRWQQIGYYKNLRTILYIFVVLVRMQQHTLCEILCIANYLHTNPKICKVCLLDAFVNYPHSKEVNN